MQEAFQRSGKARFIRRMFTELSESYDHASTAVALKKDGFWREFAASQVNGSGESVLDVACGTGELTSLLLREGAGRVVGVDFCEAMLRRAALKCRANSVSFALADAEHLPFRDESFTCAVIGFALRNVTDMRRTLDEMVRVVRRGGRIIVLDLGKPRLRLLRKLYYCYLYYLLPRIGALLAREGGYAYYYLPHSLTHFPAQDGVRDLMREAGLRNITVHELTGGIAAVHVGERI